MSLVDLKPPKSAAPGQYAGFSLQQVRLCYHLLRVPDGDTVSLEYLDDVAVHRSDGTHLLEQSKSALSGNPAANKSEELWKSFANWAAICDEGLDPAATDFDLYIAPVKTGDLVEAMHAAISDDAVAECLKRIRKLIDAKKPDVGCAPFVAKFLAAEGDTCAVIIKRFRLHTVADPIESIREQLRAVLPSETIEGFCAAAIGMARDSADTLIRAKKAPVVDAKKFRKTWTAFVRKYDLLGLLNSKAPTPASDVVTSLVATNPTFVAQLQAIEASNDLLVTAVGDYLRAQSDKIDWADEGIIVADSLDELDEQLVRQHKMARDEIEDTHWADSEAMRGRALYRKCASTVLPLEGKSLPAHFIPGSFNCLSNDRKLGWHPGYQSLFPSEA